MPAEIDRSDKYRGIAENLREIARGVRFERRRAVQLCALADGFERYAERLEREAAYTLSRPPPEEPAI